MEAVKARINDTTPSVVVVPRDPSPDAAGQAAQVDFLSLREVTPAGDLVWAAHLRDGRPFPDPLPCKCATLTWPRSSFFIRRLGADRERDEQRELHDHLHQPAGQQRHADLRVRHVRRRCRLTLGTNYLSQSSTKGVSSNSASDAQCNAQTANNYTFSITPAFLKFTLRLDSWNWSSRYVSNSHETNTPPREIEIRR